MKALNRGRKRLFLSLLERLWLKSEIRRQTMEADTTQFQASNGKQPRGFGRWGFQIGNEKHFVVGRYSNSKKDAFKIAQPRGEERVVVLPDKKLAPQGCTPERPEKLSIEQINIIKERLMAQAETRTFRKGKRAPRVRTVIPVNGMKAAEVMVVFDVQSTRTAHCIAKRGFYIVDYTKPAMCPGEIDIEDAYRISKWWFYRKLAGRVPWWAEADDMIQDAVTRLIERAGDPRIKEASYRFYVVRGAMSEYLRRNQKHDHEDESRIDSQMNRVPESWKYGAVSEGCQHCAPSPPTWQRKHSATEAMCRVIEAKGIAPMARAA
jgi:hypothetical protein